MADEVLKTSEIMQCVSSKNAKNAETLCSLCESSVLSAVCEKLHMAT